MPTTVEALMWQLARWGRAYFTERQLWRWLGVPPGDLRVRIRHWIREHPSFFWDRRRKYYMRYRKVSWTGYVVEDLWGRAWWGWLDPGAIPFWIPVLSRPGWSYSQATAWRGTWRPMPHRRVWRKWLQLRQGIPIVFDPQEPALEVQADTFSLHRPEPIPDEGPRPIEGGWSVRCIDFSLHPWAAASPAPDRVIWFIGDGTAPSELTWSDESWPALALHFHREEDDWRLQALVRCRVQVRVWCRPDEAAMRVTTWIPTDVGPVSTIRQAWYPAGACARWRLRDRQWAQTLAQWYSVMERALMAALHARGAVVTGRYWTLPVETVWWPLVWLSLRIGRLRLTQLCLGFQDWEAWLDGLADEERRAFEVVLWTHTLLHGLWQTGEPVLTEAVLPIWHGWVHPVEAAWQAWLWCWWKGRVASVPQVTHRHDGLAWTDYGRRWLAQGPPPFEAPVVVAATRPEGLAVLEPDTWTYSEVPARWLRAQRFFYKATLWEWRHRGERARLTVGTWLVLKPTDSDVPALQVISR